MRYVPGYKGPTLPGPTINPKDPRLAPATVTRLRGPAPTRPMPAPTGPMTPVRGGGMLPQSIAVMAKPSMKKGGVVKSSASKRADGCATKGKTKGRII
jgi:hypothetical protein